MAQKNQVMLSLQSTDDNVGLARITAAAFASQVDLTLNEIEEIKVAVSEAVSNAVIHGYGHSEGMIQLTMRLYEDYLEYTISDQGKGIADIALARQPAYSTNPERTGLGFVFMDSFMDEVNIDSAVAKGTTVRLVKNILANRQH